jgi:hypothetical protein
MMAALELPSQLLEYFEETPIKLLRSFSNDELMQIVDKRDRPILMKFLKDGGFELTSHHWRTLLFSPSCST